MLCGKHLGNIYYKKHRNVCRYVMEYINYFADNFSGVFRMSGNSDCSIWFQINLKLNGTVRRGNSPGY